MRAERLFLQKMASIEEDLATPNDDDFALIRAATTMYHLLCDGLLDQANRETRARIRFHVWRDGADPMRTNGTILHVTAGPIAAPIGRPADEHIEDLTVSQFLAYPIASLMMNHYSVRDILDVAANALGGKHYGEPRRKDQAHLMALFTDGDQQILQVGFPNGAVVTFPAIVPLSIRRIGPAVLSGLDPLRRQLAARSG